MKGDLYVEEIFGPTIQGEGKTAGKITNFLRLSGCNLHCLYCDTKYSWDRTSKQYIDEIQEALKRKKTKSLVITGGEPLLQQEFLQKLIIKLRNDGWWIELETNGTIIPTKTIHRLINQINCSPKLAVSGVKKEIRINREALDFFSRSKKTIFKFVVDIASDIDEVNELVEDFKINRQVVYLMAQGISSEEQKQKVDMIIELCERYGYRYGPRLHTLIWGNKKGV